MIDSILSLIVNALLNCWEWFDDLMTGIPGSWNLLFTFILIILITKFILSPLIGGAMHAGSDRVKHKESTSKADKL